MRKTIIGVMGGGNASPDVTEAAYRLGALIAREGWVLLNGGRAAGVMDASARGAAENGGLTVGILPGDDFEGLSDAVAIAIPTGIGMARNCINVLASDVVVACPGGTGTLSEIALALKCGRPVILLGYRDDDLPRALRESGRVFPAATPEEAVAAVKRLVDGFRPVRVPRRAPYSSS